MLAAPGEGPSPLLDFLEGSPWWVKVPVGLVVVTSPWWGPALKDRLSRRAPAPRRRRKGRRDATPPHDTQDGETDRDGLTPGEEDEELRKLRDSLIEVLQDLQAKSRQAAQLARDLEAQGALAQRERDRAERLARELEELRPEVMRLREQVDMLIGRRERTPPRGQAFPPTDSMPRREP